MRSVRTLWADSVVSAGQDSRGMLSNNAWVRFELKIREFKQIEIEDDD